MLRATSAHGERGTVDIGELGTIAILATHNLLFLLVVVTTREEMTKDELRGIDLVFRVNLNGNAIAVILNTDGVAAILDSALHSDVLDRSTTCLVLRTH